MKKLIAFTFLFSVMAHADKQADANGLNSESLFASGSSEPSLSQLYACARLSSPSILNINRGAGIITWVPDKKDNFHDDGSEVLGLSLWSPAGRADRLSGFITITDKQILFTPAEMAKDTTFGKSVELEMRASSIAIPTTTFGLIELRNFSLHDDGYSSARREFRKPENDRGVKIDDGHIVYGDRAAHIQETLQQMLKERIENSGVALKEYSALLSRPSPDFGLFSPDRIRHRKTELSMEDVEKFRTAYCACEPVAPQQVTAARKLLTGSGTFLPLKDRDKRLRRMDASDLDCGSM